MTVAAAALLLGGGTLAVIAGTALAHNSDPAPVPGPQHLAATAATISCPDVGERLRTMPRSAQPQVSRGLAALDRQVSDAYHAMTAGGDSGQLLGALARQRRETIGAMADAIAGGGAQRPDELLRLSACTTKPTGAGQRQEQNQDQDQSQRRNRIGNRPQGRDHGQNRGPGQGRNPLRHDGPSPDDFLDITTVRPGADTAAPPFTAPSGRGAATGTFTSACGRNEDGHFNSDNVIVTPGVSNGAHHTHDYVGNTTTDAFSTDRSLAAAGTTCANGDLSTYYWPVLRRLDGTVVRRPGAGHDGNDGSVLTPASVTLTFRGSQAGAVRPMPRFLRVITGDAKAFTNGPENAAASWSCTGFENRQLKDKYPLCPRGSQVVRTLVFPGCWDGRRTDSANHRDHMAFARRDGACPRGFTAVPQLVQRLTYDVPPGDSFAVDSFPEQLRKPVTDHGDFIDVMPDGLMNRAVVCINGGRACS
ncbi:DUF1996 domain-containing protein [Streptomyces yunnanensis]|uniref:DUF1996 domain-containing protein n=1 Tax=Streptomyces yunnanensis TaxID=156453 RepID=A0ABY8AKM7_9ACTN|nr:DUF1996 domain-containing protein [Streptomyces yunnanensis]WEB45594.1 DUF1996 domain-containing protein [Streptomyces yunnanensis]